jgi:hypothetical protein
VSAHREGDPPRGSPFDEGLVAIVFFRLTSTNLSKRLLLVQRHLPSTINNSRQYNSL